MKRINLFVIIFVLSFVLSACGTEKLAIDLSEDSGNQQSTEDLVPSLTVDNKVDDKVENNVDKDKAGIVESQELSTKDWLTMKRPREKFSIKHPKDWYYISNFAEAKKAGYEALIGFGNSSAVWKQNPPYAIEIIALKADNIESLGNYSVEAGISGDNKFIIRTSEKYKQVADLMAKSFKAIEF